MTESSNAETSSVRTPAPTSALDGAPLFAQAMELWVAPELERRRASGTRPEGFVLEQFQIVMHVDRPHLVRLNHEVRGVMQAKVNRAVEKGAQVFHDQIDDILSFDVTQDDPNAGHLTALLVHRPQGAEWALFFDFRYNSDRVRETLGVATEFLLTAESSLAAGRIRAAVENLFTVFELAAKATLLLLPDRRVLDAKSHGTVGGLFNVYARTGNIDSEITSAFRRASELRPAARYPNRVFKGESHEVGRLMACARRFLEDVRQRNRRAGDGPFEAALG